MDYIKASLNWEEFFIQEALELEEKMTSFDLQSLNDSRLRICLEKKILDWNKYQSWVCNQTGIKSISSNLSSFELNKLCEQAKMTYESYSHFGIWNKDLIPVAVWDKNLIVFGLAYEEKLVEIKNCIFILAEPNILTSIAQNTLINSEINESAESESSKPSISIFPEEELLSGINLETSAPSLNFKMTALVGNSSTKKEDALWDYISERHDEYCFEAKKQFNAYAVLRVINQNTKVYKLDEELEKQINNKAIFEFNLKESNPFNKVFQTGTSEAFNISQLGISILDYKYVCITALKRGSQVVGFLLGLKSEKLAEMDQLLLEDLAKESA